MADALKKNKTLLSLDIGDNRITDGGAEAMIKAIAENKTLKSLDMGISL
jgi:hypothetical protein